MPTNHLIARRYPTAASFLLALISASAIVTGTAHASGTISGRVVNSAGVGVAYTRVTWGAVAGCGPQSGHAFTSSTGNWATPTIPNGSYSVGNGASGCVDKAYLCTAGNAPTVNNNNVTGINFVHSRFTITTTPGTGGSMKITYGNDADSPTFSNVSGGQIVPCGADIHFKIVPDPGHTILDVRVDNVSVGAVSSYTFAAVGANHSISATFSTNSYVITASAGSNGTIAPTGPVGVGFGGSKTFTISPNSCYHIANVTVDGSSVGAVGSYTFTNVQANHTISASFAVNGPYTVSPSAGPNGTISPSSPVSVGCGGSQTFVFSPAACYQVSNVVIDGQSVGTPNSYAFANIQSNHTIAVSFALNQGGLPRAPSGLTATNLGTAKSLQVSWQPVSGASSYLVTRTGGPGFRQVVTSQTSYLDSGLPPTVACSYTVAATNSCGTGSASGSVTRAPDYYPILFVHGLCGGPQDFTSGSVGCFPSCAPSSPSKLGDVLYRRGLSRLYLASYNVNDRAYTDVGALRTAIDNVLAQTGDPKVILVAHSMGGLISRSLLQTQSSYRSKLASLIMIGTPNHGSALANLSIIQGPYFCLLKSQARFDLVPGSAFLNQLNYGSDRSRYDKRIIGNCLSHASENIANETNNGQVAEWNLMGTGGWCGAFGFYVQGFLGCYPNDGVVANADSRLTALSSARQRTDAAMDPSRVNRRATHFKNSSDNKCNQEELLSPTIADAVFQIVTTGTSPEPNETPMGPAYSTAASDPDTGAVSFLPAAQAQVESGSAWLDTVLVDPVSRVAFIQLADVTTGLTISLQSPSGVTYTASDTSGGMIGFEQDPDGQYQAISVPNPEPGNWVVSSELPPATTGVDVIIQPVVSSPVAISLQVDDGAVQPGGEVHIVTSLGASGAADPTATLSCDLQQPDSSVIQVSLYDDGQHGDGAANDGSFGGTVQLSEAGVYGLTVRGSIETSPTVIVQRAVRVSLSVEALPDPSFEPGDLIVHRPADAVTQDSLLIGVTVHNSGSVPVAGAVVTVSELGVDPIATVAVDIPAGGAVTLPEIVWVPSNPDTATLLVTVGADSKFLETRLDNNSITAVFNPSRIVGVGAEQRPLSFALYSSAPNPTTGRTTIRFVLPWRGQVKLRLYDVMGRNVRNLIDGNREAGENAIVWDGRLTTDKVASSGVYFYELQFGSRRLVRRLVVVK